MEDESIENVQKSRIKHYNYCSVYLVNFIGFLWMEQETQRVGSQPHPPNSPLRQNWSKVQRYECLFLLCKYFASAPMYSPAPPPSPSLPMMTTCLRVAWTPIRSSNTAHLLTTEAKLDGRHPVITHQPPFSLDLFWLADVPRPIFANTEQVFLLTLLLLKHLHFNSLLLSAT